MIIDKIYDYKKLERVTHENGSRYYIDPEGNHISSVTTILSATSHKPELEAWKQRVGLVEAKRQQEEATGLGSLMHQHLENFMLGEERPSGTNMVRVMAKNMADVIINRGLVNVNKIWGVEEILYCMGLFAGTSDVLGVHKNEEAIMDFKTTKRPKTLEQIGDYKLQTAAYAIAHDELYGTKIKKGVIFMVSRGLEYQEFIFEGHDFENAKDDWFRRLEMFLENQIN